MLQMPTIENIRDLWVSGMSQRQISRMLGVSRTTVRKYLAREDFNEKLPVRKPAANNKIDAVKPLIREMIDKEDERFRKQRFTATRMQTYLVDECGHQELARSYHSIRRYMNEYRARKLRDQDFAPGTMPLVWHPGEAQADFGEADFEDDGGALVRRKYLVMSFPYSNRMVCAVLPGEDCECVCQGLRYFFEYLGGVPRMILFDNATGIGRRVFGVMRESELFVRFRLHYGFQSRYANTESGWEKGCVENAVGAFRRNCLVPPLRIDRALPDYDLQVMLPKSFAFRERQEHYLKGCTVGQAYERDKEALHPLPAKAYEVRRIDTVRLNLAGTAELDGKHRYSLGQKYAGMRMIVSRSAWGVCFHTMDGMPARQFARRYGDEPTQDYDVEAILGSLVHKPNAWPNSCVREAMEDGGFRDYLDRVQGKDRTRALYLFKETVARFGFPVTSYAFNTLSAHGKVPDKADVQAFCLRLATFPPDRCDNDTGADLQVFDRLLPRKEVHHAV